MRSTIRNFVRVGLMVGACVLSAPVGAQGKPEKTKVSKAQAERIAKQSAKIARLKLQALCDDGVWSIHVSNPCMRHDGFAARQSRRSAEQKASDRAVLSAARRDNALVARVSTDPIAR